MHKLILDTDIGTDVDDALALALLLGSDKIELKGITTVYGDTRLRAQIAMHLTFLKGKSVPTFAGEKTPISGKEVWLTGREGRNFKELNDYQIEKLSAVEFLIKAVNENEGQIEILAIGPLTNIAKVIRQSAEFQKNIKRIWIMGGDFTKSRVEHNFKCDIEATKTVLESQIPITILDLPSAQKVVIRMPEINRIKSAGILGPILYSEIIDWIQPRNQDWTIPHDPIAALNIINPELFHISAPGYAKINSEGFSSWSEDSNGNVRLISPKEPEQLINQMIGLIEKA